MKKFTFKGVLDGFRSSVQAAPRGVEQEIQETLRQDHFQIKKMRWLRACSLLSIVIAAAAHAMQTGLQHSGDIDLTNAGIDIKERYVLKLLQYVLETNVHSEITTLATEYKLDEHLDKYVKQDVVKTFLMQYKYGSLPLGEVFAPSNMKHRDESMKVFHLLYYAKDFDTFIKTACWLRVRMNTGMFVYAFTIALMHRDDCKAIRIPPPYEIYPFYYVNNDVIHKAHTFKQSERFHHNYKEYFNIIVQNNMVVIDSVNDARSGDTCDDDKLHYFTEDFALNTYNYYFHMDYPAWMADDAFAINKERRGEMHLYLMQQLLARYRLERLSHDMCDAKMLMWDAPLHTGYWPNIMLENGDQMPLRTSHKLLVNEDNIRIKNMVDTTESMIRENVMRGVIEYHDGRKYSLKHPEDIEMLGRLISKELTTNMIRLLSYSMYGIDKMIYVPTALDKHETFLRDPVAWMLMKRVYENVILFKSKLPKYTRPELDFPGVKIEDIVTDKLVTYWDKFDMDITNAVYLNADEIEKGKSDYTFVNRKLRLNVQPFKVNIIVSSDKATDAVVRVFVGPKYDCMGKLLNANDKKRDMLEIDSFVYKLETGANTIVRDSLDMHHVFNDNIANGRFGRNLDGNNRRVGFPHHLLLPRGQRGGFAIQLYAIVTPIRSGKLLNNIDIEVMRARNSCRWSACFDTMPLGYPFDRDIDETYFYTDNMKFVDCNIYHRDANNNEAMDTDELAMMAERRDISEVFERNFMAKDMWFSKYIVNKETYNSFNLIG